MLGIWSVSWDHTVIDKPFCHWVILILVACTATEVMVTLGLRYGQGSNLCQWFPWSWSLCWYWCTVFPQGVIGNICMEIQGLGCASPTLPWPCNTWPCSSLDTEAGELTSILRRDGSTPCHGSGTVGTNHMRLGDMALPLTWEWQSRWSGLASSACAFGWPIITSTSSMTFWVCKETNPTEW